MPNPKTKGITVRVDAELHAEIRDYLKVQEMTMGEFIALAAQDELHPRSPELQAEVMAHLEDSDITVDEFITLAVQNEMHPKTHEPEVNRMEKEPTRTLAFQVPESLFERVKQYLERNKMTQKAFVVGLIEDELDRDEEQLRKQEEAAQTADEEDQNEGLSEAGEANVSEDGPGVEPEDEPEETAAVGDFEGSSDELDEDEIDQGFTEIEDGSFPEKEDQDEALSEAGEALVSEDEPEVEQEDEPEETAAVGDFEGSFDEPDEDKLRTAVEVDPMPDLDEEDSSPFPEPDDEEDQDYGMSIGY